MKTLSLIILGAFFVNAAELPLIVPPLTEQAHIESLSRIGNQIIACGQIEFESPVQCWQLDEGKGQLALLVKNGANAISVSQNGVADIIVFSSSINRSGTLF
jgi:hypothetical protein